MSFPAVPLAAADPVTIESDRLWVRAQGLIPAGTQTLAKGPGQHVRGFAPKFLVRGKGARVWDADGNSFLDFTMGVGPLILGYGDPAVDEAIRRQLEDGITFSLMHPLEVEVAEEIRAAVPSRRKRPLLEDGRGRRRRRPSGSPARSRAASASSAAATTAGTTGTSASRTGTAASRRRSKELVHTIAYNDLESVAEALDAQTACVILEPVVFEAPRDNFLARLKALCEANGTLLVFDEMWTGFRVALGGAQELFGVTADLVTYSKAVANGMPLSVLAGRREVMSLLEKDVFFFTTFGGEALSLAAARATLRELRSRDVPRQIARHGRRVREGVNALAAIHGLAGVVRCAGPRLPGRSSRSTRRGEARSRRRASSSRSSSGAASSGTASTT